MCLWVWVCVCTSAREAYLPAAMIGRMVEGGDAVEEAGQLLLRGVSFSALQQISRVIRELQPQRI